MQRYYTLFTFRYFAGIVVECQTEKRMVVPSIRRSLDSYMQVVHAGVLQELLLIRDDYIPLQSSFFSSDEIASVIFHKAELQNANVLIIFIFNFVLLYEINDIY
jgi:hypothetical protein